MPKGDSGRAVIAPDGSVYRIASGTRIQNPETFAGRGTNRKLHPGVAEGLTKDYGGNVKDWQHRKGIGTIEVFGEMEKAEVHWFQSRTAGKHKLRIKRWLK